MEHLAKSLARIQIYDESLIKEVSALLNGNKSAAARARKHAMDSKNELHELRKHCAEAVKSLKSTKTKTKAAPADPDPHSDSEEPSDYHGLLLEDPVEPVAEPVAEPVKNKTKRTPKKMKRT